MIEWRWNLRPLTVRDASANNLATSLNFQNRDESASVYVLPPGPFGIACAPAAVPAVSSEDWDALRRLAISSGWPIP